MNLSSYLQDHDLTDDAFAKSIRVTKFAVRKYKRGERNPKPDIMVRIERVTGNLVTVEDMRREYLAWRKKQRKES